jgi:hypothetical protein
LLSLLSSENPVYKVCFHTGELVPRYAEGLSAEQEAARAVIAQRKLEEKAAAAAALAEENAERKKRLAEAGSKGRDVKGLTAEQEADRQVQVRQGGCRAAAGGGERGAQAPPRRDWVQD